MDGFTLRALAAAAHGRCAGARIDDLRWVAPNALLVSFGRRAPALVLSPHPELAGLYAAPPEAPRAAPPALLGYLRRHLGGGTLRGVATPGLERVVFLEVERISAAGAARRYTLILEAMSRWSNLVLAEGPERTVLAALKVFPGGEGARTVAPGQPWTPPPRGDRPDPADLSPDELAELLTGVTTAAGIAAAVSGISPETARLLLDATGAGPAAALLHRLIAAPPAEGSLAVDARGRARLVPALMPASGQTDLLAASAETYRRETGRIMTGAAAGGLRRDLGRRLRQLETLRGRLGDELDEAGLAARYQSWGSLLIAHLPAIARGADRFVTDSPYGQPGEEVSVPLDPRISPAANAERLFRKARKMKIRAGHLGGRVAGLDRDLERTTGLLAALEGETDAARLEELEAAARKLLRRRERPEAEAEKPAAAPRAPRRYLEYLSAGGWRMAVGKDAASNDHILSRVAAPDDLWCHAEGFSGAHVILKGFGSRQAPPEEAIREACMLAAWHSQGRAEGKVTVSYTRRKHVHKPTGAAPGLVVLRQRRTLTVPPRIPDGVRLRKD